MVTNIQKREKIKGIGTFIIIILLVLSLGLIAVNQGLEYFYRSEFLQNPCDLCKKLNPERNQNQYIYKINLSQEINFTKPT